MIVHYSYSSFIVSLSLLRGKSPRPRSGAAGWRLAGTVKSAGGRFQPNALKDFRGKFFKKVCPASRQPAAPERGREPAHINLRYNACMNIALDVPLKDYSTMRLGGRAAYMCEVSSRAELEEAIAWADERSLPAIMIGSGSNIIWQDAGFPGLVILCKIMGFEEQIEDEENYYVTVGAGENWDSVVARTVARGATGIEALSLIPGTAGATPVQNVGAYGQEISQTLVSIEAYDRTEHRFVTIPGHECAFAYRSSRFKTTDRGRFFITSITLHLLRANPHPPFYAALQGYLDSHGISDYTPAVLREAVIAIRSSKLPDPNYIANNGSFFANPIINEGLFAQILADYPDAPHWPAGEGKVKVPAAWLLQTAGFKGMHDSETGMATWPAQPLVLVNEHAASTAQLIAFRDKIIGKIEQMFSITLEQEPELLPAAPPQA